MTTHPPRLPTHPARTLLLSGDPRVATDIVAGILVSEWFRVRLSRDGRVASAVVGNDWWSMAVLGGLTLVPGKIGRLGACGEIVMVVGPASRTHGDTCQPPPPHDFSLLLSLRFGSRLFRLRPLFRRVVSRAEAALADAGMHVQTEPAVSAFDLPVDSPGFGTYLEHYPPADFPVEWKK